MTQTAGALVLFSGGQDSAVCLSWALERFPRVETIGFDYGQRHAVELTQRKVVLHRMRSHFDAGGKLGDDHLLALPELGRLSETSLTRDVEITLSQSGLPSTFVPGRNLLFLTYAAALGYRRGLPNLVGGMCETDYSGYPDCRRQTMDALQQALSLGTDYAFEVHTPLMYVDKAGTWALAHRLGGDALIELIVEDTHTCYLGDRSHRHPWGYGCGSCPACDLRAKGWTSWSETPMPS